jgi:hypothetical protein
MKTKQLQLARALDLPTRQETLNRDHSVQQFWASNDDLISDAWKEWEASEVDASTFTLDDSLLDKNLREAVQQAWENPSKEHLVKALLEEVAPDVFQFQFFDPERLTVLRGYLDQVWDSNIPMRPIARLLFPEITGYDTQTFGFSIYYDPSTDASIRPHTDASAVTLNINLNLPGEEFTGSELDFYDLVTGKVTQLSFKPGIAMIHRGSVAHAAKPITSGDRTNFVLWLFGDRGRLPAQGAQRPVIDATKRWTTPVTTPDGYAPF